MCIAVPVEVLSVDGMVARVARGDAVVEVSLLLLGDEVRPGDYLIVQAQAHAIARLDAEEARARLALFAELIPVLASVTSTEDAA